MMKTMIALLVAAGFAGTAFAQSVAPAASPTATAPVAKVAATTAAEKKVEAPKASDPVKVEVAKPAQPVSADTAKMAHPMTADTARTEAKVEEHAAKPHKTATKVKTDSKPVAKSEMAVPVTK